MRRTKEEAEQTRRAILDAAVDVFLDNGVAKATIAQIASAARVTRGAVYWHFSNKTDIFIALHDEFHQPLIQELVDNLENMPGDPLDRLEEMCCEFIVRLDEDKQLQRLMSLFFLKCDYSGNLQICKQQNLAVRADKSATLSLFFTKAQQLGTLSKDLDPHTLTTALNCFFRGIVTEFLESDGDFALKQEAPKLFRVFFGNWRCIGPNEH